MNRTLMSCFREQLKLYRDAENELDEWAVGVYYGEDDLLGDMSSLYSINY